MIDTVLFDLDGTLLDTLQDIVTWTNVWSDMKGTLYLGELSWLSRHLQGKLFKLGRLQFCMAAAEEDIPAYGITKGENVMEIHIPRGGKLDLQEVQESIEQAKVFFAKYFPEFSYRCFTCHSWLLDKFVISDIRFVQFSNFFHRFAIVSTIVPQNNCVRINQTTFRFIV